MFNKETFKTKLDFMVRQWHSVGAFFIDEYGEARSEKLMNDLWAKSVEVLWATRCEKRIYSGIDNAENFDTFCEYITIAFNQLSNNIMATKTKTVFVDRILEQQKLIRDFVEDVSNEFEENFIDKQVK